EIRLTANAAAGAVARPADAKAMATPAPAPEPAAQPVAAPVRWAAARWSAEDAPAAGGGASWNGRRVLILTDRPAWCLSADVTAARRGLDYRLACSAARHARRATQ